jgi:hypothetical protein
VLRIDDLREKRTVDCRECPVRSSHGSRGRSSETHTARGTGCSVNVHPPSGERPVFVQVVSRTPALVSRLADYIAGLQFAGWHNLTREHSPEGTQVMPRILVPTMTGPRPAIDRRRVLLHTNCSKTALGASQVDSQ